MRYTVKDSFMQIENALIHDLSAFFVVLLFNLQNYLSYILTLIKNVMCCLSLSYG